MRRVVLVTFVLMIGGAWPGTAQPTPDSASFCEGAFPRTASLDTRGLKTIYCTSSALLAGGLWGAHRSARPVFYGAVPLAWGWALARRQDDFGTAYRLTVAQAGAYGLVVGLKHAVGRPRPFVTHPLSSRSARYGPSQGEKYQSFPSGHAAVSAAIATSWSLSVPRWYVVGPGIVWAVGVSVSRVYLGVHYPSDVLVGTALGAGVAVLVHHVCGALTPPALRGRQGGMPVGVTIRF